MSLTTGQRAGKLGRVSVNGTPLQYATWSADEKTDDEDTTNFESAGFDQGTTGCFGCDISAGGLWNALAKQTADPPGIFPRDNLANLQFFHNIVDNTAWLFPYSRILSARNGAETKGKVTHEFSGKSNGPYIRP